MDAAVIGGHVAGMVHPAVVVIVVIVVGLELDNVGIIFDLRGDQLQGVFRTACIIRHAAVGGHGGGVGGDFGWGRKAGCGSVGLGGVHLGNMLVKEEGWDTLSLLQYGGT